MSTILVEFADITQDPASARCGATPAKGMPDSLLDALIGAGWVEYRDYAAPGVLKRVTARFPTDAHREQFALSVRQISNLMGTRATVFRDGLCTFSAV
ncbi:hypothetical protein AWB68_02397 [Caballeronia choica]|jgi:hypothetical protein|uniref:Uncharacterized protein n=1 Tax=Caballeronia choica TaxID=326476 RepID=A0A158HXM9_9BURK|nr:hypothetical protein [Caballeronia choica]SAL48729.1 hypothetical protein AWB68_02397 [Caballeronia choica]